MRKSVGRYLSILHRKTLVYLNKVLKPYHITGAELPFLMYLYDHQGTSQEALSQYLSIDKASTTRAIQTLANKGLVIKQKDLNDRRMNHIFLTELALQMESSIKHVLDVANQNILKMLSVGQKTVLFDIFDQMVTSLEFLSERGEPNAS